MPGSLRRLLPTAAGILLAAALLWWVLRQTPLESVAGALGEVRFGLLLPAAAIHLSNILVRVRRWRTLLRPVAPEVSGSALLDATVIGFAATVVFPGRVGELVRPAVLSWRDEVPLGPAVGSVVAERLLDGCIILLLFAAGLPFAQLGGEADRQESWIRATSVGLAVLFGLLAILLLLGLAARPKLEVWSARGPRAARWALRGLLAVLQGSAALIRPRLLPRLILETLAVWLLISAGLWLAIRACGPQLAFGELLFLLPLISLGVALPTPGGTGGYHAAVTFGLSRLLGAPEALAVSAALVTHLMLVIPPLLWGTLTLVRRRLALGELVERARQSWRRR